MTPPQAAPGEPETEPGPSVTPVRRFDPAEGGSRPISYTQQLRKISAISTGSTTLSTPPTQLPSSTRPDTPTTPGSRPTSRHTRPHSCLMTEQYRAEQPMHRGQHLGPPSPSLQLHRPGWNVTAPGHLDTEIVQPECRLSDSNSALSDPKQDVRITVMPYPHDHHPPPVRVSLAPDDLPVQPRVIKEHRHAHLLPGSDEELPRPGTCCGSQCEVKQAACVGRIVGAFLTSCGTLWLVGSAATCFICGLCYK